IWRTDRSRSAVVVVLAVLLGLAGCTSGNKFQNPSGAAAGQTAKVTVTPADNATDVPVSAEIGVHVDTGKVTGVTLADAGGAAVYGTWTATSRWGTGQKSPGSRVPSWPSGWEWAGCRSATGTTERSTSRSMPQSTPCAGLCRSTTPPRN